MHTHYNINWLKARFNSGQNLKFIYFWGQKNKYNEQVGKFCLSQWFESSFTVGSITYKTAEHWMMAHKAMLFNDKISLNKILDCQTPGEAKKLGQQILGFEDPIWDLMKFEIVKSGNIHKFNQHAQLAAYLLNTENRILVEASPLDIIWGIGMSQDSKDIDNVYAWKGQNLLGFALMEARDFLKAFGHFKPLVNSVQPPWEKYPQVAGNDIFWQTGKGEEYLTAFNKYFQSLTDREQTIYKITNLAPYAWVNFYNRP